MTYRLMFKKLFFVVPASILLFYSLWLKPMKLVNLIFACSGFDDVYM